MTIVRTSGTASVTDKGILTDGPGGGRREFLTFTVGRQTFGLPLGAVDDVLDERPLTPVPLAPAEVAGSINLRGRIITAIDVRRCLGMPKAAPNAAHMSIVTEHDGELFSLVVDAVGEVIAVSEGFHEDNPVTLDEHWRGFSAGIYRLESDLMVVLEVGPLLDGIEAAAGN
ncbi:MAG: chemotaxis protein CheW [Rhodospirillales bacterium]|nr:chemotaxis protein CheW [Rhodospirillales bacterium]